MEVSNGLIGNTITVTDQTGTAYTAIINAVGPKYYYFYDVPYNIADNDPITIIITNTTTTTTTTSTSTTTTTTTGP